MIGSLKGIVDAHEIDGRVTIDVAGVGYEVHVPISDMIRMVEGESVSLRIHTHVREDALVLYGFATVDDRNAFRTLLGVNGVGPRVALSILNTMSANELALAVAREDKAAFKGISGVGKKTAERLLLDLRDKLPIKHTTANGTPLVGKTATSTEQATAVGALVQMGFKQAEAEKAVEQLGALDGRPAAAVLKDALANLR